MPDPVQKLYISQITLPDGNTYELKDLEARDLIEQIAAGSLVFVKSVDAASTPYGVQWKDGDTTITGTLVASTDTKGQIYLVPQTNGAGKDIFAEYVTVNTGTTQSPTYAWEKLGDTEINFDSLGTLAYKNSVTLNKQTDTVLGNETTFTAAASAVTFTGDASDTFVKSYPGTTSKLATTTIKGVGASDVTFDAVASHNDVSFTKITLGSNTSASAIETETKTATSVTFDTANTASYATAGTAVTVATRDANATNVSYIGNANTTHVITTATVSGETLTIGREAVTQGSVTGTNGTETITPYTFSNVSVPNITAHEDVNIASVKTNTPVTVPVVSTTEAVSATLITVESKTAATSAASATTVATGSLDANDATGSTVMTGLGTAVTASAVTDLGTATAAAQTITVGSNDEVSVLTDSTDVTVS